MHILVIHGPNINLLGKREPEQYGTITMDEINEMLLDFAKDKGLQIDFYQSNIEGELVSRIQNFAREISKGQKGIIINPAAYTHSSVAIRDALSAVEIPAIEVHLSNIYKREEFRQKSLTAPVCLGQISGLGALGYKLALQALIDLYMKDHKLSFDFQTWQSVS
jgi:3-dehydroquinate dehydratase-2